MLPDWAVMLECEDILAVLPDWGVFRPIGLLLILLGCRNLHWAVHTVWAGFEKNWQDFIIFYKYQSIPIDVRLTFRFDPIEWRSPAPSGRPHGTYEIVKHIWVSMQRK